MPEEFIKMLKENHQLVIETLKNGKIDYSKIKEKNIYQIISKLKKEFTGET